MTFVGNRVLVTVEERNSLPSSSRTNLKIFTKTGFVDFSSIGRREAIPKLLEIHDMEHRYTVLDDGPPFVFHVPDRWYVLLTYILLHGILISTTIAVG